MTGNTERTNAIGRVAILISESERVQDGAVEIATADARALLDERVDLTEKLAVATRTVATLAAQRDSMEAALNQANAELHLITRCGDTFEGVAGITGVPVHPCARERGHTGAHGNRDGAQWWPHLTCTDDYKRGYDRAVTQVAELFGPPLSAMHPHNQPRPPSGTERGYAQDAAARIAALPDMGMTHAHFSPGYDGEIPDHQGTFDRCAMPACVTSRNQTEAANHIQDLTLQLIAETDKDHP